MEVVTRLLNLIGGKDLQVYRTCNVDKINGKNRHYTRQIKVILHAKKK